MEAVAKPVVLIVDADLVELDWGKRFLEDALEDGALLCQGPGDNQRCPLLTGHDCSLIHQADGIMFELDLDRDEDRDILQRYTEMLDVPIRVVATPEQLHRYPSLLENVEVVAPPVGPARLDAFAAEIESSIE
ncbi:MAG: hypothetical protein M3P01_08775 [Actinomycetota bacterium]|nr:hypothetical protein [Actinomycetota bacterium]